jgi:hypothetical protein
MEKHPFFMTKAPETGEQMSPLVEGLQQLKYSETDNTPQGIVSKMLWHSVWGDTVLISFNN